MSKHNNKSKLGRRVRLAGIGATGAAVAVTAAAAFLAAPYAVEDATAIENPHQDEVYLGFTPMADEEMDSMRGGFINFNLFGSIVYFGAEVRTTIDGALKFLTTFTSPTTSQMVYDPGQPTEMNVSPGDTIGDIEVVGTGNDITDVPGGGDLGGLSGHQGIVISDADGFTAVLHHLGLGGVINSIVNEANGRDIVNEFNVHVTFENSGAFLHSIDMQQMQIDLSNMNHEVFTAFGAAH